MEESTSAAVFVQTNSVGCIVVIAMKFLMA
jgi:hypothetical protein